MQRGRSKSANEQRLDHAACVRNTLALTTEAKVALPLFCRNFRAVGPHTTPEFSTRSRTVPSFSSFNSLSLFLFGHYSLPPFSRLSAPPLFILCIRCSRHSPCLCNSLSFSSPTPIVTFFQGIRVEDIHLSQGAVVF